MIDSILIGMTGMEGFSRGLQTISNNVANLNTPGFKSSTIRFTDAYYQQGGGNNGDAGSDAGGGSGAYGTGLVTLPSVINFQAGSTQQTNNPLDVSIGGEGYLVLQDRKSGALTYTRDGQLQFDSDGYLVSTTSGKYVLGYSGDTSSSLGRITLDGLKTNPAKPTSTVVLDGNLTTTPSASGVADTSLPNVVIYDQAGGLHTLTLDIKNNGGTDRQHWTVSAKEGDTRLSPVGSAEINFLPTNNIDPGADSVVFSYKPPGLAAFDVKIDFSPDVEALVSGSSSSLAVKSQDGYAAGSITATTFDADGKVSLSYTNGQTASGAQLALATVDQQQKLHELGQGEFGIDDPSKVVMGRAKTGSFGSFSAGTIEMSNVDLSGEFSDLIIMQRGYQAASNVLSTANDMLQQLFQLHGGR